MEKNPWKTISEKEKYDNAWINVRECDVINPAGNKGIYGVVHFKNKALGIIPVDNEGNTWLVGQFRYALNEYSWEIPMGGGPLDVDILTSAKKELKEETGLTAKNWKNICRIHTSNSATDEEGFIFLATQLTEGDTNFEDTEDIKVWKLPLKEAVEMVMNGKITDAISIAGLLKVEKILS